MKHRSSIHRHWREDGADHITTNGNRSSIRSENVVTIDIVRYDGRFGHIDVHVLEHVSSVCQVQQDWLMSVLGQAVRLDETEILF